MDQINKLYEELVMFDPSLIAGETTKEAVLQVIEKMVKAKPTIHVNEERRESFAERLSDYIEQHKVALPYRRSFFVGLTKWSMSLATFFIAVFVVGAGYLGVQVYKKGSVNIGFKSPRTQLIQQDVATGVTNENIAAESIIAVDSNVAQDSDVTTQAETSTALSMGDEKNDAVREMKKISGEIANAKKSTDVDIGGSGGGVAFTTMNNEHPSLPPEQRKMAALVFSDEKGVIFQSSVIAFLQEQGIVATFIETNTGVISQLESMGYETIPMDPKFSSRYEGIVRMDISDLLLRPELLEKRVAQLQAKGYIFVKLSAMQTE